MIVCVKSIGAYLLLVWISTRAQKPGPTAQAQHEKGTRPNPRTSAAADLRARADLGSLADLRLCPYCK